MTATSRDTSRRTLVKGAAWSVPVLTLAGTVPARAASVVPEPGLNGWVVISREQTRHGIIFPTYTCDVRYDGYRNGDATYDGVRLGLWVWDATQAEISSPPTLIIHLPYEVSWSLGNGSSGWSLPTLIGSQNGLHLYRSTYNGGYTDNPNGPGGLPEVVLTGRPHFVGRVNGPCPTNRLQRITRRVGIGGEIIEFTREVYFPSSAGLQGTPEGLEGDDETGTEHTEAETATAAPEEHTEQQVEYILS